MEPLDLDFLNPSVAPDPAEPSERVYAQEMGYPKTAALVAVNHVSAMAGHEYDAKRNCLIGNPGSSLLRVLRTFLRPADQVILTDPTSRTLIHSVQAVGARPILAPLIFRPGQTWAVNYRAFADCITDNTKAMLLQSPCMPSGALFSHQDWGFIGRLCVESNLLLIFDTSFDTVIYNFVRSMWAHPASFPGMKGRTLIIGSGSGLLDEKLQSFEYVVGPEGLVSNIRPVVPSKPDCFTCCEVASFRLSRGDLIETARKRRDMVLYVLRGLPIGIPAGGWSLLLRVSDFGLTAQEATGRLAEQGVKVRPMDECGDVHGMYFVRLVFAHQRVENLATLRSRVEKAFTMYEETT